MHRRYPITLVCLCCVFGCDEMVQVSKIEWVPQYTLLEGRVKAGTEPEVASQCRQNVTTYRYYRNPAGVMERAERTDLRDGQTFVETFELDSQNQVVGTVREGSDHQVSMIIKRDSDGQVTAHETWVGDGVLQSWTKRWRLEDHREVTESFFGPQRAPLNGETAISDELRLEFDDYSGLQVDFDEIPIADMMPFWSQFGEHGLRVKQIKQFDRLGRLIQLEFILTSHQEIRLSKTYHYVGQAMWMHAGHGGSADNRQATCSLTNQRSHMSYQAKFSIQDPVSVNELSSDCDPSSGYILKEDSRWTYDADGQLREQQHRIVGGQTSRTTIENEPGLRIVRVDDHSDGQVDQTTHLYLDHGGHRILKKEDYDGDGETDWQKRYAYDAEGNRVLSERDRNADGRADTRWMYLYDEAGTRVWEFKIQPARAHCLDWASAKSSADGDVSHP